MKVEQPGGQHGLGQKTHQRQQKRRHPRQKTRHGQAVGLEVGGLAEEQQDDGDADQERTEREQPDAAIGQPPTQPQVGQFVVGAGQKLGLSVGAGAVFHHAGPVDDAGQPARHSANHAGHGREQKHGGHRQLDAVGDGRGVKGEGHGA